MLMIYAIDGNLVGYCLCWKCFLLLASLSNVVKNMVLKATVIAMSKIHILVITVGTFATIEMFGPRKTLASRDWVGE